MQSFLNFIFRAIVCLVLSISFAYGQAFLESEARSYRQDQRGQLLLKPLASCFQGYEWSPLSRGQCDLKDPQKPEFRAQIETKLISNRQQPIRLLETGPLDYPIYRRSFDFGLRGEPRFYGESFFTSTAVEWKPSSHFSFQASILGGHSFYEEKLFGELQSLALEASFQSLIFSVGRQPIYWGQSAVSPLILGDNAQNLDMIRLSTKAFEWPGFLRHLGALKAETFLARMEEERSPSRDWLLAWRVGIKPSPRLELNFAYLYQFGGEGIPKGSAKEWLVELAGARLKRHEGDETGSDVTNRSGSMDLRWQFLEGDLPSGFYTEHHLEDCCGSLKVILEKSYNYTYGFETLAKPLWSRPLLQLEYTKTTYALYRHHRWTSGTSRLNQLMGHPLGRDAQGLYLFARTTAWRDWSLGLSLSAEEFLRTGRVTETRSLKPSSREQPEYRLGASPFVIWKFHPHYELQTQMAVIGIENQAHQDSQRDLEWMAGLRLRAIVF